MMVHKIKLKKGFKRDLPQLSEAEPGFCTDTGDLYVGASEGNVHINPVKSVNGMTGDVEVTNITGKASKDSDGNVIKDTYVKKNGDISNTNIGTLDTITGEFPVPAAGESTKTFLGKMKKFAQDFNNFKTGIVTLGMLVNNTGTNRADLPAAAGAVFNLQQQVTKLNSDMTYKLPCADGYDSIASASEFANKYMTSNVGGFFVKFRDTTGWCPDGIGWYRAWVTYQNTYNNGVYDLDGKVLLFGTTDKIYFMELFGKLTSVSATYKIITYNGHTHDDRYYTESEIDLRLDSKHLSSGDTVLKWANSVPNGATSFKVSNVMIADVPPGDSTAEWFFRVLVDETKSRRLIIANRYNLSGTAYTRGIFQGAYMDSWTRVI